MPPRSQPEPDAKLVGLWNRTRARGLERARQLGCRFFDTAEELAGMPEIDAVFVLTNLETHLHYARMAFAAGKHVLCEKPVAASTAEVEEIQREAARAGRLCTPGHNMIYEESIARTRRLLTEGKLGRLVSVYVLYNIWHSEERASTLPGIVRQILTHNSYCLIHLAGAPEAPLGLLRFPALQGAYERRHRHGQPGNGERRAGPPVRELCRG